MSLHCCSDVATISQSDDPLILKEEEVLCFVPVSFGIAPTSVAAPLPHPVNDAASANNSGYAKIVDNTFSF